MGVFGRVVVVGNVWFAGLHIYDKFSRILVNLHRVCHLLFKQVLFLWVIDFFIIHDAYVCGYL